MAMLAWGRVDLMDICLDLHGLVSILDRVVSVCMYIDTTAEFTFLCLSFFDDGDSSADSSSDASSSDELSMP